MPAVSRPSANYKKAYSFYEKQYGVSGSTIKRWAKAGLPLDDPDSMRPHLGAQKHTTSPHAPESLAQKKERKLAAEIEKLEIGNAVLRREFTANAQIREDITAIATAVRGAFMRLENDLPGELAGLDETAIQLKLRARFDEIIGQFNSATSDLYPIPVDEAPAEAEAAPAPCSP